MRKRYVWCENCNKLVLISGEPSETDFLACEHKGGFGRVLSGVKVTVYRDKNGHTIFPGETEAKMPARYAKEGYERVEMNFHEARKFTKEMNGRERSKAAAYLEGLQRVSEEAYKEQRSDLLHEMRGMSTYGREFAEYVIDQMNSRDSRAYLSEDPGFHNEALDG